MPNTLKKLAIATTTAAVVATGGVVAVDNAQKKVDVVCNINSPKIEHLDTVIRSYKINDGLLKAREMTAKDKSDIKGCEIAKAVEVGFYDIDTNTKEIKKPKDRKNKNDVFGVLITTAHAVSTDATFDIDQGFEPILQGISIEIVNIEPIDGGVSVYARAWALSPFDVYRNDDIYGLNPETGNYEIIKTEKVYVSTIPEGGQIGFGKDGTVDIERFRIFNPPILVTDKNGDIIKTSPANEELEIEASTTRYREDPEEALLQTLEEIITLVGKPGDNIEPSKIGNTTSTFYASDDWRTFLNTGESDWASAVADTPAGVVTDGLTTDVVSYIRDNGSLFSGLIRAYFVFNTSALPDTDSISSATYSLKGSLVSNPTVHGNPSVVVTPVTTVGDTTGNVTDHDIDNFGSRASDGDILYSDWAVGSYNDFALNATGIAAISKTGYTKFGVLSDKERDVTDPGKDTATGYVSAYMSEDGGSGTTNDPKLVVEHAASGGGAERRIIRTISY